MKKTLCFICTLAAATAYAQPALLNTINSSSLYAHGFYLGVQAGRTELHNKDAFTQTLGGDLADAMLLGLDRAGAGIYAGYRFNDYFGTELGFHQLASMEETGGVMNVKNHTRVSSGDLFAKGSWPLCKYLSPFVKGGVSYVYQDILSTWYNGATIRYKSKTGRIMPALAAGFDVHFTRSFAIDASWIHWFKNGSIHDIDFPSVGISYTFGD